MKMYLTVLCLFLASNVFAVDKKVSELNALGQASWATNDLIPIVDTSANESKKTTIADFDSRYLKLSGSTTDNLIEGSTNLYFTTARARSALSATSPLTFSLGAFGCQTASGSQAGCLSAADWTTFNGKQSALSFGNITGSGITVTGGTGAAIGSGVTLALTAQHDLWVDRNGTDASGCGTLPNPCQTVGYAFGLVTSPSSTNNWTVHLMSGRHDQETNDILIPPYTWLVGNGGPDVGSYLRLPAGKALKLASGWTVNARGGVQSIYFGGSSSVNLDFAAAGGSAGANFMFDDVFVTGSFTHTGRGVNGGDFVYVQNSFIFGAASFTASELQSFNSNWGSTVTMTTSATVGSDATFLGGMVSGNFAFTETNAQTATLTSTGTAYTGTFTTTGTLALTVDDNLPPGYSLSGGTTRTNTKNAAGLAYVPTTSGNWASVPALVGSALDSLAGAGIIKTQTANTIFGGPTTGAAATPGFRALVAADLPTIALTNDVTGSASGGSITTTVASVGGSSAANVHAAELLANAATNSNTNSAIVKRDGSGNFSAGTISAALTGTASGNTTYTANNHGVVASGSANAMTVIAPDASTSKALISGGASADPAWGLVSLTAGVSGVLPIANSTIATQAISSTAIDWSTGSVFTKTLGANTTFTFSNQTSGQTIVVRLTNTASNYTVTWPSVKWVGGAAPTMTIGATSDVYTFVYDGTNTYGSVVQDLH